MWNRSHPVACSRGGGRSPETSTRGCPSRKQKRNLNRAPRKDHELTKRAPGDDSCTTGAACGHVSRANNATTEKEHAITTTTRTGYGRQRAGIGLTERMKACRTCSTSWGTYGPVAAYPFDGTRDLTPQTLKPSYSSLPVGGTPLHKVHKSPPAYDTMSR